MSQYYVLLHDQLDRHPRIARGWVVYGISRTQDLRFLHRGGASVLQQQCTVTWKHPREQHIGGGYYSTEYSTSEWLDVPMVTEKDASE